MLDILLVIGFIAIAYLIYAHWARRLAEREAKARRVLQSLAPLGDVVPPTLHPRIDQYLCIGSGACVEACPEVTPLAIVDGRSKLVNPLSCVGHGECADACPFDAISLVFGTERRGVELPVMDTHFQTNQPGVYIVGELGGMGLIRNAVRQGSQAASHIVAAGRRGNNCDVLDALVVGAGPAGVSATLGLMQGGLNVALLDREDFGGTILHYPRGKIVMTGDLEFPLYGKVARRTMCKEELLQLFQNIRKKTSLEVTTGVLVTHVNRIDEHVWQVTTDKGEYRAANVVLAVGRRGSPNKLGVCGEELPKVVYRLLEPEYYAGSHVLVVGGGNSAVECALSLAESRLCLSVAISYRRPQFVRLRADVNTQIEQAITLGRITAHMGTTVEVIGENELTLKNERGEHHVMRNDAVIVQIGGTLPSQLLQTCSIKMVQKFGER